MFLSNYKIIEELFKQRDISFLVLTLFFILLPISINLSTFTLIVAILLEFLQVLLKRNKLFSIKALKHSGIIGLLFFTYIIISSIIQTDFSYTITAFNKEYQHFLLLIIAPALLRDKRINSILIKALFLGVLITITYVFVVCVIRGINFDRYSLVNIVDLHHTYLSMYLLFLVNFLLIRLVAQIKTLPKAKHIIGVLLILGCFGVIYTLNSKVSIIIFIALFLIHLLPQLSKKTSIKYLFIFSVIFLGAYIFNNKLNHSYKSALDFRIQIWDASLEAIKKRPIFGNLQSSEKDLLNFEHYLKGKYYFLDSNLNSHNQYLSILLSFGLFGALIFFLFIINIYRKVNVRIEKIALRELFGFCIIVLGIFYIESILARHHGIVFFTFFYNYYLVAIYNENN